MKKLNLLLLLIVLSISVSFAQRFGVKGGLNITNLKVENHNYDPKMGFHLGPVAEFHFGNIFGLETGILLTTKGGTEKIAGNKYRTSLTYLEFPLNFRAGYDFGPTRVYGILGPYFGLAVGGKFTNIFDDTKTTTKIDFGEEMSRFDAGLTIGASAAVHIFEIGFSYNHGFVNISELHDTKNRAFYISVAYKFGKNPFKDIIKKKESS